MDLYGNLETYIAAQKGVGFNAFVFSAGLIISSVLFHLFGTSQLSNGMRNGTFIIGIILITMGIGLRISQERILKEKKALFEKNEAEFKISETERMAKVKGNYPRGQLIMAGLVTLSLVAFLLIKSNMWQGVFLSFTIFFVGNIIIEAFSYLAIVKYYQTLIN